MQRPFSALIAGSLLAAIGLGVAIAADEAEKPKHEIKDVMTIAHKEKLRDKVLSGDATAEEKRLLLDAYASLLDNEPPKGEMDSWKQKSNAVIAAAARVMLGREGADEELKAATNCAACHREHRGS